MAPLFRYHSISVDIYVCQIMAYFRLFLEVLGDDVAHFLESRYPNRSKYHYSPKVMM